MTGQGPIRRVECEIDGHLRVLEIVGDSGDSVRVALPKSAPVIKLQSEVVRNLMAAAVEFATYGSKLEAFHLIVQLDCGGEDSQVTRRYSWEYRAGLQAALFNAVIALATSSIGIHPEEEVELLATPEEPEEDEGLL